MKTNLSPFRIAVTLYVCAAIFSFGPAAMTMRNGVPPGNAIEERRGYATMLALFVAAVWPLYWSYEIANRHETKHD